VIYTNYLNAIQLGLDSSITKRIQERAELIKWAEMQHHADSQIG
tara:strand:- start:136 stop:267 length:132 start_codon:yes stop_codon:yes gene_type:complete